MELRQLAYLVAVAEERSFTGAARRELVAQPGISAQIRRLEAELGQPLFDRRGASVTLTAAGDAVLPYARIALAAVEGVRTAIAELAGLLRGRVAIGVVPSVGGWLADALAEFHRKHPGVEITLVEDTSDALLESVRSGLLDLALAGLSGAAPDDLRTATVTDEPLVAAVNQDHPLSARRAIGIRALAREPLIALPRGTGGRTALDHALATARVSARVAFEAGDPRVLMALAERGLGVAIVPASAPAHLHALEIRPGMRSRLDLAWRADGPLNPAAVTLIDRVCESLSGQHP
jgi:DNA-binding transcriptional LysR family regulator